jgi:hypothetical protein
VKKEKAKTPARALKIGIVRSGNENPAKIFLESEKKWLAGLVEEGERLCM